MTGTGAPLRLTGRSTDSEIVEEMAEYQGGLLSPPGLAPASMPG